MTREKESCVDMYSFQTTVIAYWAEGRTCTASRAPLSRVYRIQTSNVTREQNSSQLPFQHSQANRDYIIVDL